MKILFRIFLAIFITGCAYQKKTKVIHPTQENLELEGKGYNINVTSLKGEDDSPRISKFLSALQGIQNIATIGTLYGDENKMFGFIKDIAIDSFHRMYILDSDKQLIRVFSQKGPYITSLGGKGEGPGELEFAKSIAIYKDTLLLVSNGYRIEVFNIEHRQITFLRTLIFDTWAHSLCVCGDKLFVHNNHLWQRKDKIATTIEDKMKRGDNIQMIQAYAIPSFKPLFSFGQSYKSKNPMVVDRLTSGSLSCNVSSSTVIFTFDKIPVLQGYAVKDGRLKWKSRMSDLHFPSIIQTSIEGRTRLTYKRDNIMDWLAPPVSLEDHYEFLQVRRRLLPTQGNSSSIKILTFLLDSSNGKGTFLSKKIPEITAISDSLIAVVSDNFLISRIYTF